MPFGLEKLPEPLRARTDATIERLRNEQPALLARVAEAPAAASFGRLLATSEFAGNVLLRWPELAHELLDRGRLDVSPAQQSRLDDAAQADEETFARALRRVRQREMLGIAWRDLTGLAGTGETLEQLSALADSLLAQASDYALGVTARKADALPAPPLILAMGKLGGRELNFSSDIDLIFLFADEFEDAARFYLRHARRVIALLDQRSEHGFVFRVDTRLRPFGRTGALVLSLGAFEDYLQVHAREWERYAYVKARTVTGHEPHRARLYTALHGFVYRRYIDYGLFESLREMKTLMQEDVRNRALQDDIKRGDGGIREIEFVVQALQLIRGGRQPGLQTTSLRDAMRTLEELAHISPATSQDLTTAYDFLRRLENRLQMWADAQTHSLPADTEARLRLALAMDCSDWPQLATQIGLHRDVVRGRFGDLLGPANDGEAVKHTPGYRLWHGQLDEEQAMTRLAAAGVSDPGVVRVTLERLRRSPSLGRIDRLGRRRLDQLMPGLLDQAAFCKDGATVLPRIVEIIEGVGRRSAYFSLLNENPQALERLIDLCRRSANIARQVAANPLLLDSLIDPGTLKLPTPAERAQQLHTRLRETPNDDLELLIETLAHFKHSAVFEVAVADLSASLTVMKVSDHLTTTAEIVLREILRVARARLVARHGVPVMAQPGQQRAAEFCVVAYGKLGGLELGYGSDLDLVFVHDAGAGDPPTSGPRVVASSVYFARLVQRVAHIAGAPTRFGALYQVDMRLRPSGSAGPLVTSISAFERYQRESAWTWEHQALLRARAVAGDEGLCRRFALLRQSLLLMQRDEEKLAADILTMRQRMRKRHYKARPGRFDIKHGPGGLLDAEFLIQYWLLCHAHRYPSVIAYSDHMRQLDALGETGAVVRRTCRFVQAAYLDYRTAVHRLALLGESCQVRDQRFIEPRKNILSLWREVFHDD